MLQDKPAAREAPLIILLFGNVCSQNTRQSISYSMKKGAEEKSKKYKVSRERLDPPPPPLSETDGCRFSKVVHLSVMRLGWLA